MVGRLVLELLLQRTKIYLPLPHKSHGFQGWITNKKQKRKGQKMQSLHKIYSRARILQTQFLPQTLINHVTEETLLKKQKKKKLTYHACSKSVEREKRRRGFRSGSNN
ncbi:hypothetical protein MLD38_027698 [Melastoma candidum]|uniref:Uncharacterized protein n=1 Tax=Melastoma candidum TaxID=119954 RepID=A0ACB9P3K8_9MYRT|nr:hypothetical protein MLD38_027698 [Melastoma candidum]